MIHLRQAFSSIPVQVTQLVPTIYNCQKSLLARAFGKNTSPSPFGVCVGESLIEHTSTHTRKQAIRMVLLLRQGIDSLFLTAHVTRFEGDAWWRNSSAVWQLVNWGQNVALFTYNRLARKKNKAINYRVIAGDEFMNNNSRIFPERKKMGRDFCRWTLCFCFSSSRPDNCLRRLWDESNLGEAGQFSMEYSKYNDI